MTELCCALAVRPDRKILNDDDAYDVEDVISVCAELVIVDEGSNIIRLVHYTRQDYFERELLKLNPGAYEEIAVACSTYLSFDTFRSGSCANEEAFADRLTKNAFLDYSAHYWSDHVRLVEESASQPALGFLRDEALVSCTAQAASDLFYRLPSYSQESPGRTSGLHLTARYGLLYLTGKLLMGEGDSAMIANIRDSEGNMPLFYAADQGYEQVVKLLLDNGADVNEQSGHYGNALRAASASGHEQVVKLLLDKGADVNAQGEDYGNALQAASGSGHEQVVKMLLDKGADVNAQGGDYGNALQTASGGGGHEQVVKLLLDKGADVNAQSKRYGNALQAASASGHEQVVKLLLDKGADVNAQGGLYSNALQAASASGHEQVVKLLLDKGADVNAEGGVHGNAL